MNRDTAIFLLGMTFGAVTVAKLAKDQHDEFCRWDEKKNEFINNLFHKLQDHAPPEVIEQVKVDATILSISLHEDI